MRYISTRGSAPDLTFEEAMLTGLARDGGLYVPAEWPQFSANEISAMAGQSYEDVAFQVMRPFIGDCFTDEEFGGIIARAYSGFGHRLRAPLVQIGEEGWVLDGCVSQSLSQARDLWRLREDISETITPWTPYKNDISTIISKVPDFLAEVEAADLAALRRTPLTSRV